MGRNRFLIPEVTRIPLSDGDWIEVKKYLNNGDHKRMEAVGQKPPVFTTDGGVITPVDWEIYEIGRAAIYLLDWSFRDATDKPVVLKSPDGVVSIDAIKALDIDTFEEINKAIMAHVVAMAKEKNDRRVAALATQTALTPATDNSEQT